MAEFGLGAHLVEQGAITREQLEDALAGAGRLRRPARHQSGRARRCSTSTRSRSTSRRSSTCRCRRRNGSKRPTRRRSRCCRGRSPRSTACCRCVSKAWCCTRALIDPADRALVGALTRDTGRSIQLYVLPELRLRYALERHLGIARPVAPRERREEARTRAATSGGSSATTAPRKCGCAKRSASARSAKARI